MSQAANDLYEQDFYAWTRDQAEALRRLAAERWNGPLDLDHLAEEVEDLGTAQRASVFSQVERLAQHLLKLEYSRLSDPRNGWANSANSARTELEDRLTPSLRRMVEEALPKLYSRALRRARRDLESYGEEVQARCLPSTNPFPLAELLDEHWYPTNRHGLGTGRDESGNAPE